MIFNGHTAESVNEIDEETFTELCVMYGDGVIGGHGQFDSIAPLTTQIFNYIRDPKTPPIRQDKIFPWIVDYQRNPVDDVTVREAANNALLAYMTSQPGFNMERMCQSK
jgi:hypothetical protein